MCKFYTPASGSHGQDRPAPLPDEVAESGKTEWWLVIRLRSISRDRDPVGLVAIDASEQGIHSPVL